MTGTIVLKLDFTALQKCRLNFKKRLIVLSQAWIILCFLDDILIVSRGIEKHLDLVQNCLIKLDQENLRINLANCHFAKDKIEWLRHNITQTGITPLSNNTDAIGKLSAPSSLKKTQILYGLSSSLRKIHSKLVAIMLPTSTSAQEN